MSLDWSTIKELNIPEGKVVKIEDSNGNTIYEGVKHGSGTYTLPISGRDSAGIIYNITKSTIKDNIALLEGVSSSQIDLGDCNMSMYFTALINDTTYYYLVKNQVLTHRGLNGETYSDFVQLGQTSSTFTGLSTNYKLGTYNLGRYFDNHDEINVVGTKFSVEKYRRSNNSIISSTNNIIGGQQWNGFAINFHSTNTNKTFITVDYTY